VLLFIPTGVLKTQWHWHPCLFGRCSQRNGCRENSKFHLMPLQ